MRKTIIAALAALLVSTAFAQLTFWTTEEQPARLERQQEIAANFEAQTGISVDVVPVSENILGERVTAAFAAGDLPDIIYHPLNFTLSWYEAGVLDAEAATEVVDSLGRETFGAGALNLVGVEEGFAGVPVDGWTQLIVYRQDLFDAAGLEPPTTFANIAAAAQALHDPPNVYGFVAATDPSQVYMMQVLEEFFLANGVTLLDEEGNVDVDNERTIEVLNLYKQLVELSPPGNLFWQQSRELYQAGQAAMIVWSPFILDELAGLRDSVPVTAFADPTSPELAKQTGIVTTLAGPSNPGGAGWADVRYFGITIDADTAAAQQFVEYSMNEGYLDTLAVAPEGKFPVRRGTLEEPTKFVDGWAQLDVGVDRKAPLSAFYSQDVINDIVAGLETGSRWGFAQGQGSLTSKLYGTRTIAELVRAFTDGERTAEETAALMQFEIEALK